jgi:DNA mismatch repair ATPase MutS
VQDSLEAGISYFMAELKRLKQVVDAARTAASGDDRTLLYLLDEILQGTNTAERQVAVRQLIGHLLAEGAIGAVSTHDLNLAQNEGLAAAACPVHFRETVHAPGDRPPMSFDYLLRPGLATSSNALRLMKIVGLGVPS